ncbi:CARDB domain-containing protein [Halopenitus persicus]|uniref:PGF-CTERM protein/PGF-pre-PGF domain-containing protein n=1 Tax=Halopenitus persicus TaxID=1048396 RepID=A0A1H3HGV9_9EURY|nr:CARDB domain-containing protein [Halopenitus persicus]SDY14058.1 PGF-CTERM protein/PGF-pre-PGF domain-containing protein [Halopenitus persicus]
MSDPSRWLAAGRSAAVIALAVCLVLWAPAGVLGPAVGVGAAQEETEGPPQTPASYYGNVTIDGEPAPAGTVIEAEINGTVAGSITINESGTYGGPDALDEKLLVEGGAGDDGAEVRFFVNNGNIDRTEVTSVTAEDGSETVTWESGDVQRVDLAAAVVEPQFAIDDVNVTDPVTAGDDVELTLTLNNTGVSGSATVSVVATNATGTTVAETNVTETIDSGASAQTFVAVPTSNVSVDGSTDLTLTVDTGHETAETTVTVEEPPQFDVSLSGFTSPIDPGTNVSGTATVNNTGGQEATQNLTVTIDDATILTEELTLSAGESQDVAVEYETDADDAGDRTLAAATADDATQRIVTVNRSAEFAVDVIEGESTLDVVAGQDATLVAEVENVGGTSATKDVTVTDSRDDTELTNETVTLEPGEITDVEATAETSGDDTDAGFDLTVESPDDAETVPVTVEDRDAFLDVTNVDVTGSVDEPFAGNTNNITVDATVENLGTESTAQTIEFRVDGEVRNSTDVSFDGTGSETLTGVTVPVRPGDAPEIDLVVASEDAAAAESVTVTAAPEFETTIVEASNVSDLAPDDEFTPTINVTNVGGRAGNGEVTVRFNNSVEGTVQVDDLAAGTTETVVDEQSGGIAINVTEDDVTRVLEAGVENDGTGSVDDVSTRTIDIGEAPNFAVENFDVNVSAVDQGDAIGIDAEINNTGEVEDTQTFAVTVDGREIHVQTESLNGSDNPVSISESYQTRGSDVGDLDVSVSTDDDSAAETVTVRENAEFEVDLDAEDETIAGTPADAFATVENVGGLANNETTVRLLSDGEEIATETAKLDAGEARVLEFSDAITPESPGELEVTAATTDDASSDTIAVGAPGELALKLTSVTDPVTTEESLRVGITAENVGDESVTETVRLRFDGQIVDQSTITVAGGESRSVTFTHDVSSAETGETSFAVLAANDAIEGPERTVSVEEPPADPNFRVSDLEGPTDPVFTNRTVTVAADVTNIGEQEGTQTVSLSVDGTEFETTEETLPASGDTTVEFEIDTDEVGAGEAIPYTVASENGSAEGTLTVEEPTPGTLEVVSTELLPDSNAETATQGDSAAVNATVENVGDLNATNATVELEYLAAASVNDTVEVSELGPGNTTTVTLAVTPPAEARAGTFDRDVEVRTNGSTVRRTIPVDFGSIQSGVDAAATDATTDVVEVAAGDYTERNTITVDADGITIEPARPTAMPTINSPRNAETGLVVTGADVTVSNLRFVGDGNGSAIELAGDGATVSDVRVENWDVGIEETNGTNTLRGASVVDSGIGLLVDGAGDSRIEYARVARSDRRGIVLRSADNTVRGSGVHSSTVGVDAYAPDNDVRQSTIRNNGDIGVRVSNVAGNLSQGNPSAVVRNSALESNGIHAHVIDSEVDATSNWWGSSASEPVENEDYIIRSALATEDPLQTRPDSDFTVESFAPEDATRDETYTVNATVNNTGSASDLQTVELVDAGTVIDSRSVELNASEQATVTFSYTPDVTDGDQLDLTARTLDDSASATVSVLDPALFEVTSLNDPTTNVMVGDTLSIDADLENTGEAQDTRTVTLLVNGSQVDSRDVTLSSGGTETPTLTYTPTSDDVGAINVTVDTGDDARSVDVTVAEAPAFFDVTSLGDPPSEVTAGDEISIDADLENTGGLEATQTVRLLVNGSQVDSREVTLAGGDTATPTLTYATDADDVGTLEVTVETENATESGQITVVADDGNGGGNGGAPGGGGGGGGGGGISDAPEPSIDVEPVATETVGTTLDAERGRQVASFEEVEGVESVALETNDYVGDVTVSDLDPTTDAVDPSPGSQLALQEITVSEEASDTPATIRFTVSTDRLEAADATAEQLHAFRSRDGTDWEPLETGVAEQREDEVVLEAETPGFSLFAVSAVSQPEAVATVAPETVTTGESVELSGGDSTTEHGEIVAYDWTVDGDSYAGETATTSFDEPGEYEVELAVTNDAGETDTTTVLVTVEAAETPATPTETAAEPADTAATPEPTDEGIPGFGILVTLIALLAAAAIATRRRIGD